MSERYDAVVIGAGHNGLVAALRLRAAGRTVLVLERSEQIGGLCATYEFAPGYRVPGLLPDTSSFRQQLISELRLERHGLELRSEEPGVFAPLTGDQLALLPDSGILTDSLGVLPEADAAAYREWRDFLGTIAPFIQRVLDSPPPRLDTSFSGELLSLAASGWALRRLGRKTTTEVLRVLPMCVADWLGERFPTEAVAAAIAAPALLGSYTGPWAAGSAASLIFRECTTGRSVAGGPAALAEALRAACEAEGVDIRTSSQVERIVVDSGRATAVELGAGERIETGTVVTSCHPKSALLDLVGPRYFDATTERDLHNFRSRGTTAVMLLAVEGSVEVRGCPGEQIERLRIVASSFDELERAYDAIKYGQSSPEPYLEVWIPSLENPSLAGPGRHVVAALISCTPYDLRGGWSAQTREALIQSAVHRLNDQIPGLRDRLAGGRLLAPPDLESRLALPGGHLHHGESALDQMLFVRPSLGLSRYATPIEGLFLGGSGSHPGGGITGMPGSLAAQAAIAAT